ncbi:MAG: EAL domain-containing protein [Desulfobulbaceae bacterium]|jgi:diguanylate cyclase (GGDEF)-like protein|nr:EAL domain-containing protein [Desulfobulbaceae bacterium]MDY0352169.1 EAL domain-containing protein [Desulfobulbaceae bacterium]
MTLYRQLLIFTLVLFIVLFTGTWLAKLKTTRMFLIDQLESHAQDTATSLGLSISPYMAENDLTAVETMFNAVFDRGYYRAIQFINIEDKVVLERILPVRIEGIPEWFIHFVPLEAPRASAMVMAGWRQAGQVIVESHPGYAYKTLWETVVSTTLWYGIMGLAVITVGGMGLQFLLRPLRRVEHQADALCRRQYEIQENLPRTRELRTVVEAMNRMTYKIKEMFDEQARVAERLRKNAYSDSLTGLGNRRYLESQVAARLERDKGGAKGTFLLLQINDLQELNRQKGFQAGDDLLQRVAGRLRDLTQLVPHGALARLSGGDFGIFLPDAGLEDGRLIAQDLAREFAQLAVEQLTLTNNVGHVGGVTYDRKTDFGQLLSGADTALRAAQQSGTNAWQIDSLAGENDAAVRGQGRWKALLDQVLAEKNILLFVQKTVRSDDYDTILHYEVFSRIREESGGLLRAGMFIPLAERLGLVSALDRIVLEKAMQIDAAKLGADQLAVNISASSLKDPAFRDWVLQSLRTLPATAPKLRFEFVEYSAVQLLDTVRDFGAQIQQLGHGYGLDHFGHGFSNFGYLQSLRPDYVKIDRAYINEMTGRDTDSHFFVDSLTSVAHSLDILVIAEGVENEEQAALLRGLNLDGIQGHFIGQPEEAGSG